MRRKLDEERWERRIARLATDRHGVFSRAEALALGASTDAIQRRIASGRWRVVYRGVYAIEGQPPAWRQSLMAAVLACGDDAAASHASAAALWRLPGFDEGPIELLVPGRGGKVKPYRVHRATTLPAADTTRVDGIPVTTPARTLFDIAAVCAEDTVEIALDDALRRRLVSIPVLRRRLEQPGRGNAGRALMRELLAQRSGGGRPAESPLETMMMRVLRRHALPLPVRQYHVWLEERRLRLDFAYPDRKVVIETDGYAYHAGRRTWQRDLERRNLLTQAGWIIIHVTWEDLRVREMSTAERIRTVLSSR